MFRLIPLLDGQDLPHDLVAAENCSVVDMPIAAVQGVLRPCPALWASLAAELTKRFLNLHAITWKNHFDPPQELLAFVDTHGRPEHERV